MKLSARHDSALVAQSHMPVDRVPSSTAGRVELAALTMYFLTVVVASDLFNIRLGTEVMSGVVLVAAIVITRRPLAFLHDWWFFLVGLVFWNPFSNPIAAASPFPRQLDFMMNTDRLLFFGRDASVVVQHALAPPSGLSPLDWITGVAYNMHLMEPYIAAYFLWRLSRTVYFQFAAAVLVMLVLGFVTFILVPAIPPWLASSQYHRLPRVLNRYSLVLQAHPLKFHSTQVLYSYFHLRGDEVAAFPSEHAAFPMLELLAFAALRRRAVTVGLGLWVLLIFFTVIYLGEHWVTDVIAGYVYAVAITLGIRYLSTARLGASPAPRARQSVRV